MELYEIKNGLDKAHLLIDEYRKSAQIDEKLREIEGLSYQTMQDELLGLIQQKLKRSMTN